MASFTYQGVSQAITSGVFLCSVGPVPVGTGTGQNATQRNGIILQYNQTKTRHINVDDVSVLFFGRSKPAVQTSGTVQFDIFNLAYAWPSTVKAMDGTTTVEAAINAILADCRAGWLVEMVTSQGHGASYNGISYNALYGRLQEPVFDYPIDRPFWTTFTATFQEVG